MDKFIIEYLSPYMCYCLGAFIMIADKIAKNQKIAQASPKPEVQYPGRDFFRKESWSLVLTFLIGIASVILLPYFISGKTVQAIGKAGDVLWKVPLETALLPAQIVCGYGGGRMILKYLGKSEKELYEKIDAGTGK